VTAVAPQAVHLTRSANEAAELTQLEPLAQRVSQAMQQLLANFTKGAFTISAGTANAARYPEWRIAQNPFGAVLRYRLPKRGDEMLVHLPGFLICQIVDVYYGGTGNVQARGEFSSAEMRFVDSFGSQLAPLLKAEIDPDPGSVIEYTGAEIDLLQLNWPRSRDAIVVQSFFAESEKIKPTPVGLILTTDTVRLMENRRSADENPAGPADAAWSERVRSAAMRVKFPARTVLTHCNVPFSNMLTLAPGDILPLLLPAQVPLIVAGRVFARGTLGESNGRAALMIENIEKEMDQ
jgi:flagellar motor switch protein FliM